MYAYPHGKVPLPAQIEKMANPLSDSAAKLAVKKVQAWWQSTETIPRAPDFWLASGNDGHQSNLMTIDDNNSKCIGWPTTSEQQNIITKQYAVTDWGKPEQKIEHLEPGINKSSATTTKKVTWKTPIVDESEVLLLATEKKAEDAYNMVQSKYNKMFKGCMRPSPCIRHHPAYETLFEYAMEGCPIECGESWSWEQLEVAIHWGNHASAQDSQAAKCLHKEALKKVQQGSAQIVK